MHLKKILAAALAMTALALPCASAQTPDIVPWVTPQTASAPCIVGTLAPTQVALGRIHIHDSTTRVVSLWKTATNISGHDAWLTYTYGDSFGVRFHQGGYTSQDYGVSEVSTIAPNGIATPAGIEVGMSDDIITKLYGMRRSSIPPQKRTATRRRTSTTATAVRSATSSASTCARARSSRSSCAPTTSTRSISTVERLP